MRPVEHSLALQPGRRAAHADEPLDEVAFQLKTDGIQGQQIRMHVEIAPGYYLYRDQFRLRNEQGQAVLGNLPSGKTKFDPNFNKTVEITTSASTSPCRSEGCRRRGGQVCRGQPRLRRSGRVLPHPASSRWKPSSRPLGASADQLQLSPREMGNIADSGPGRLWPCSAAASAATDAAPAGKHRDSASPSPTTPAQAASRDQSPLGLQHPSPACPARDDADGLAQWMRQQSLLVILGTFWVFGVGLSLLLLPLAHDSHPVVHHRGTGRPPPARGGLFLAKPRSLLKGMSVIYTLQVSRLVLPGRGFPPGCKKPTMLLIRGPDEACWRCRCSASTSFSCPRACATSSTSRTTRFKAAASWACS